MKSFDVTRPDFAPYGLTCERWRLVPMPRPDRHNEIELNLLLSGSLSYLFGGVRVTIPERGLATFLAAVPHQVVASPLPGDEADYYVVTIPLLRFLQLNLPDRLLQPILHGQMVLDPQEGRVPADRDRFEQWCDDLAGNQTDRHRAVLLEIEARLLRLALRLPEWSPGTHPASASRGLLGEGKLSKAEQMATYVARHYTEPLQVEEVSRSVACTPATP
jgi:hypothetical protein